MINGKTVFYRTELEDNIEHEHWIQETRERYAHEYQALMNCIKGEEQFETVDISGMGGGYERACQLMLRAGISWLAKHRDFVFDYETIPNVYGIAISDSASAKELDQVLLDAAGGDCTGAQHQCVIGHLAYIHKFGLDAWLASVPSERRYKYPNELPASSF